MKQKRLARKKPRESQHSLITDQFPFHILESYKAARTNLMFSVSNEKCPVVLFTSALPFEGKTTTSINMAITFAKAGFKTLLIDADMRKPRIYKSFGVAPAPGLSDIIAGFSDNSCMHGTSYENLFIITSGTMPPNPAELMMSPSMELFLQNEKDRYDYIFIDSPPVTVVTDAVAIANRVSGVVVVVRQGYSHKDSVSDCVAALEQVKANVLGTMLNGFEMKSRKGYGKYRYYQDYVDSSM